MSVEATEAASAATDTSTAADPNEAAPTEATTEDLVAAAKSATASLGQSAAVGAESQAEASQTQEEEPRWSRLMRERDKAMEERNRVEAEAASHLENAKAEAARIVEEARKAARAEAEAERSGWMKRYQQDPESALRDLGGAEEVASKIVELNTPHGRALAALRAELAETKGKASEAEKVRQEFEAFKRESAEAQRSQQRDAVTRVFLGEHANAERAPYLHARYDAQEIIAKADAVADEWRAAKLDFSLQDIAEYMEADARKRLGGLASIPVNQVQTGKSPGNASQVSATSRTITAASAGSERRAAPKPFGELTPQEQHEDLLRVAREAMRSYKAG